MSPLLILHHYITYFLATGLTFGGQQGIMCRTTESNNEAKLGGKIRSCQHLHSHTV